MDGISPKLEKDVAEYQEIVRSKRELESQLDAIKKLEQEKSKEIDNTQKELVKNIERRKKEIETEKKGKYSSPLVTSSPPGTTNRNIPSDKNLKTSEMSPGRSKSPEITSSSGYISPDNKSPYEKKKSPKYSPFPVYNTPATPAYVSPVYTNTSTLTPVQQNFQYMQPQQPQASSTQMQNITQTQAPKSQECNEEMKKRKFPLHILLFVIFTVIIIICLIIFSGVFIKSNLVFIIGIIIIWSILWLLIMFYYWYIGKNNVVWGLFMIPTVITIISILMVYFLT